VSRSPGVRAEKLSDLVLDSFLFLSAISRNALSASHNVASELEMLTQPMISKAHVLPDLVRSHWVN